MRLVAIVARVGASVGKAGFFSPRPLAKGADDCQEQPLGELAAAAGTLVAVGSDRSPSWSPDGKKIAFVRQRGEGDPSTVCNSCIYKIRVDGTGLKRLTGTKSFATDPAWSPNGKKIAFSKFVRRMKIGGQVFTMNATDGSQKRNLTNSRPGSQPAG